MSIRITALYLLSAFLVIYAWKDWFKSLCGLILMMAVIQHEDMPKSMFGIQGLNTWNILFLGIFLAWFAARRRESLIWDMPLHLNILIIMYFLVIFLGFLRAVFDRTNIEYYPFKNLISEELINTVKWILPGILLYDGCRSRKKVIMAVSSILVMYFLLAVQVAKRMPPSSILSGSDIENALKVCKGIGYSRVDMSVFLAGAFWAILASVPMFSKKKYKFLIFSAALLVVYAQALTGGRAGYIAWGATGLVLCLIKWRKYLLLAPVVVILLPIVFPGAVERMFTGFGEVDASGQSATDENAVTSDRNIIWPYVINKIIESPMIGYGRLAMNRTGLYDQIEIDRPGTSAPHPHNMYLETLLDNGIIGSFPFFIFWCLLIVYAAILFRSGNRLCSTVGGLALSLMLTQLFAGIGSQHFYPRESTMGVWTAMFLMLRVYFEHQQAQTYAAFNDNIVNEKLIYQQVTA